MLPTALSSRLQAPELRSTPTRLRRHAAAATAADAPPPRPVPKVPEGTPVVSPLELPIRPRRNRRSPTVRAAFRESLLRPANLLLPVFVHDGEDDIPIDAMPGCSRLGWCEGWVVGSCGG